MWTGCYDSRYNNVTVAVLLLNVDRVVMTVNVKVALLPFNVDRVL